jgi:hypothetical protein
MARRATEPLASKVDRHVQPLVRVLGDQDPRGRGATQPRAGHLVQEGWAIWFRFGSDEDGEYLDYYAAHRMTNDRHVRLRDSGTEEDLPALSTIRLVSTDPAEDARLLGEHLAENRRTEQLLSEKGFVLTGAEPFPVAENRYLASNDNG